MLGDALRQGLTFPHLVFSGRGHLKGGVHRSKEINFYGLEWGQLDEKNVKVWADHGYDDALPCLPSEFESLTIGPFALNEEYRNEIVRNAQRGREEWIHERHFDTMIREMCLKTAEAHTEVAFRLLADCLLDPKTGKWSDDKLIIESALLWRMWYWQTGRAIVPKRALFPRIEESIRVLGPSPHHEDFPGSLRTHNNDYVERLRVYLTKMKAHDDLIDEKLAPPRPIEENVGPVLTGKVKTKIRGFRSKKMG